MKKSLLLLLAAFATLAASAQTKVEIDGIWYNLTSETQQAEVTYKGDSYFYNEYSGSITLPATVTYEGVDYSVTSIGEFAFYGCRGLTAITLPEGVTSIGEFAFYGCRGLFAINIPENSLLTSIGESAFEDCSRLIAITIPEGVTSIGGYAFYGCSSLTAINIPENSLLTSIGGWAFEGTSWYNNQPDGIVYVGNILYHYKGTMPQNTSITIPEGVTSISSSAFRRCSSLTSITIPEGVTSIGNYAFEYCSSLTAIVLPKNLNNVGSQAFANCAELLDVYCYAEEVPSTESDAFDGSYPEYVTLHVPVASLNAYKTTAPWSNFGTIVSLTDEKVTSITLNHTEATLTEGQTLTLTATITPDDATNKSITWSSSNTSVATVDANGKVTAKAAGTATITATAATSANTYYAPTFAKPDKSKKLNGTASENLKAIFEATGPSIITSMGRMNITDEQYQEIAEFTANLVKGKTSQTEQYREIFRWIVSNVKYGQSDPDPYAVFINKLCVCQGYANLLTVMCHTQGIPTVVVNGYGWGMGHAWAYTCTDGVWEVSDPTNSGSFPMSNTGSYTHLDPSEADVDLFADDCAIYRYYNFQINVHEVKATSNPLVVPYSAGGFVIGSFNPAVDLPENITEVYIGENITTFGESYNMGLIDRGLHLEAIYVDENNPALMDYKGVVYRKNGDEAQLYYIPGGMPLIELMPMEKVEKNTIYNHYGVKEIYFPEGTKEIESYAVENCPKLERIYIPKDAKIADDALYNCPNDVEIIRGVPSGIKHVTL